jgi:hypothetical protein
VKFPETWQSKEPEGEDESPLPVAKKPTDADFLIIQGKISDF